MLDLDCVLNQAMAEGELESGIPSELVAIRSPGVQVRTQIAATASQSASWSMEEDAFLLANMGRYTESEIGLAMGRSTASVKLRRYRGLEVAGLSHNKDFMTGHKVARALGIDGHSAVKLADRGILPTWLYSDREMRTMRRVTFLRWAVNPMNWVYFVRSVQDTRRLRDAHLRRLIERQKVRWDNEWWSIGQVATYHEVEHTDVNRYVHAGKITGVKWGNWWFLRSEALKPELLFFKGRGSAQGDDWSEEADLFLITGVALSVKKITLAAMMNWSIKKLAYRWRVLHKQGFIPDLIAKYDLLLDYNPTSGELSGRWEDYGYLFPRVRCGY